MAAGRVEWKSKKVKEREDKSWRLEVSLFMPKAPDVAHVPMKFEFQPMVYYARDLVDGDKVVERKVPIDDRQPLIESVDVGFLDSGSGKIESRTRFSFKVTRAHGYEAGEYKITIRDSRDGRTIGTPTTLVFEGENETVDRRAMVFGGEKKKDKDKAKEGEDAKKDEAKTDAAEEKKPEGEGSAEPSDGEKAAESEPSEPAAEDDPDQTIKEKPGGCGCRIEDTKTASNSGLLLLGIAIGAVALRRNRRRAA
jgi:MYXO-CTERM domain-containing protein